MDSAHRPKMRHAARIAALVMKAALALGFGLATAALL